MVDNSTYNSSNSTWITDQSTTDWYYYYSDYDRICDNGRCEFCGPCKKCISKGCGYNRKYGYCDDYGAGGQWTTSNCTRFSDMEYVLIIVGSLIGLVICICLIVYCKIKPKKQQNAGTCSCNIYIYGII